MHKQNKQSGFSLVEIVTVIAVIGILLAISTISYTRVRNNGANKTRETQTKTFAAALENSARYNEDTLTCSKITAAPEVTAGYLDLKVTDITNSEAPTQNKISCAKSTRPTTSDSFFVSGLGCPEIKVEYTKKGSSEKGVITVKGPVEAGHACITPNPDSL